MFWVDMAPCWRGPYYMHAWGTNILAKGMVRSLLAVGTVFESTTGMFLCVRSDMHFHKFINKFCVHVSYIFINKISIKS